MAQEGLRPWAATFEQLVPAEWRHALESSPAPIAVTIGPRHLLAYQNRASQALFGTRAKGLPLHEAFELPEALVEPLTRALETGRAVEGGPRRVEVRDQVGADILMRYVLAPLGDPAQGVVITALDVTAEVRAEQALTRTRLLADISSRMTAAADAAAALQALTEALVPEVADVAAVYVVPDSDNEPTGPAVPAVSPEVLTVSPLLAALGPPPPLRRPGHSSWDAVISSGVSVVIPVNEATLPVLAPEAAAASWMRAAAVHSMAVVPLVVAGTFTGATVLAVTGDRGPFDEGDLPFLQDVTARASVAIGELRTARQHRELALEVQRAITHLSELLERLGGGAGLGRLTARPAEEADTQGARGPESPGPESLVRVFPGAGALTVAGEVDVSNEEVLRSALLAAASAAPDGSLVVDLTGLEWIDVAGARSLLTGTAAYRSGGGVVELVGVQSQVHRLLDLIGVVRADGIRVDLG